MWDRKQQFELDMEQLIGSKLGKEYDKAVYCLPDYFFIYPTLKAHYLGSLPPTSK